MNDKLLKAINDFFSDTSRSADETRDGLEEARDLIDELLEALSND